MFNKTVEENEIFAAGAVYSLIACFDVAPTALRLFVAVRVKIANKALSSARPTLSSG